jgi:GT2 family glycosyltransferase
VKAAEVLAYFHTYNDAEVVDGIIAALGRQTYPVREILLVDNASVDGTLDRNFPSNVTVIRHQQNLGTSGAVATAMEYALTHGYDWIYILDADSMPRPDAIEKLLQCYASLDPELRTSTWWLSSLLMEEESGIVHHACMFTPNGIEMLAPPRESSHYMCNTNMWSGSLYRLDAVVNVGLPDRDYVLDWGDVIYGYEGMIRGYTGVVEQSSIVSHHLHPIDTIHFRQFGLKFVKLFYSPPIRFYYLWKNSTYFWLYKYQGENKTHLVAKHFVLYLKWLVKASLFIKSPVPILRACLRGMWEGLHAQLQRRY